MTDTHTAVLYTKEGCCLCERARQLLSRLQGEFAIEVEEVDITSDPRLYEQYRYTIPVVVIDGRHRFEPNKLAEFYLRRALEPQRHAERRWPWHR
jgi:glutaredoxin